MEEWTPEKLAQKAFKETAPQGATLTITPLWLGAYKMEAVCGNLYYKATFSGLKEIFSLDIGKHLTEEAREMGTRLHKKWREENGRLGSQ